MDVPANSAPEAQAGSPKGRRRKLTPEERWARRVEKSLRWHEQHGFFSIRHWGLYTVPFTRSIKRLGESVAGFRALVAHVERWLCPPRPSSAQSPDDPIAQSPDPSFTQSPDHPISQRSSLVSRHSPLFLLVARKVARALAQVLWLGPRVMRERARERAIHLEARLRLMAELQSVLRGEDGTEAQAKLRATLQQAHGPELGEYRLMKIYGFDPGTVWPRRLARHMAEMVVDAVDNQLDLQRDLKVIRRRMNWLLEVYQFASSLVGGRSEEVGGRSYVVGRQAAVQTRTTADQPPGETATAPEIADERIAEPIASSAASPPTTCRLLPTASPPPAASLKAERRKFDMLKKVQQNPVESLGNPHLRPSVVKRKLSGQVRKRRPKPEPDPVLAERMLQHKLDMDAYLVAIRTEQERQHHAGRERWFAAEAGITVEELRRRKAETPDPVGIARLWHPLAGWYTEVKTWHGRWLQTIREYVAPGSAEWWPEARELKLRAEITARHEAARRPAAEPARNAAAAAPGNVAGQEASAAKQEAGAAPAPLLGYQEIKRLVAEAFGVERSQKPGARSRKRRRATVISNGKGQMSNFKLPTEPRTTNDEPRTTDNGRTTTDSGQQEAKSENKSKSKRQKAKGNHQSQITNRQLRIGNRQSQIGHQLGQRAVVISNVKCQISNFKSPSEPGTTNDEPRTTDNGPRTTDNEQRTSQITNRKLRIGHSAVRVARLLWVLVERDARRAHREASRVGLLLAAARFGELEPVRTECGCFERQDRKADFGHRERLARLAEAFWRLLVAIHGETTDFERMWIEKAEQMGLQGHRQPTEFERLRPHRSWFDPERMRMMRQALEIDPPAEDFESEINSSGDFESEIGASGDFESEIGVSGDFVTAAQASASDSGAGEDSDAVEDSFGAEDFGGREGCERAAERGSSRDSEPEEDSRPSGESGPAEETERLKESEPAEEPDSGGESGPAQEHDSDRESGPTEDFQPAGDSRSGDDAERDEDSAARSRKWRSTRSFGRWLSKVCEQWEKDNLEEST